MGVRGALEHRVRRRPLRHRGRRPAHVPRDPPRDRVRRPRGRGRGQRRAAAPALFSVALMDTVCPPSTVFAAYNHYQGPKDIRVWAFNNHEGGQTFQNAAKLQFLHDRWE